MWTLADRTLSSRLILGSAQYPSLESLRATVKASHPAMVTVSLRRESPSAGQGQAFWDFIRTLGLPVLPNTAGCRSVREAITTAEMAREVFKTPWIKLEIIADDYTLQPDVCLLVEAAEELIQRGFVVLPYTTEDLSVARRLVDVGCSILMPWAAPIGSGKGPLNLFALRLLRRMLPKTHLIVDAGLGLPSHAAHVMEMGYDGVMLNTAVAKAQNPPKMAEAFSYALKAGRLAYKAGPCPERDMATPSTPLLDRPFCPT